MSAEPPGDRGPAPTPEPWLEPPTVEPSNPSPQPTIGIPTAVWRALFWLQMVAVTALMLLPRPPSAADTGWDKLNHVLAFAGPCFAGLAALPRATRLAALRLTLGLVAWGGMLELLQTQLPPRSGEWADLLADAVGVAVGAAAYALARWLSMARSRTGKG
jgi:VanZ family protein